MTTSPDLDAGASSDPGSGGWTLAGDLRANAPQARGWLGLLRALLLCPGLQVTLLWRAAARCRRGALPARVLGRLAGLLLALVYGCYLSPLVRVGRDLRLPHPVGIVVGDGARLGDRVTLYQHVTLGVRAGGERGYPRLRDDVTVYAGAVVLGGIEVGERATIGANAVLTRSCAAGAVMAGVPARAVDAAGRGG